MRISVGLLVLGGVLVAGCSLNTGGTTTTPTTTTTTTSTTTATTGVTTASTISGFWTRDEPSDPAIEAVSLDNSEFGGVLNATIGGVTFVAGTNAAGAVGYTAVNAGTDPGIEITTGTLDYTANYKLIQLFDVEVAGSDVTTNTRIDSGQIALSADFDTATLSGTYEDLTVAGTIVATDLDGAVTYRDVNGTLDGTIGADGLVGAFHGSGAGMLFVGGFVGVAD